MKRGFTLLELLVVVGVIALLTTAGMVIINPSEQLQKTRDAERKQDLRQLQVALQAYYEDNGRFSAADGQQIQGASWGSEWRPYMAKVPKDPLSAQSYLYQTDANGTYYRVYAKLERCPDPQMIPGANCTDYNYAVTSSNIVAAIFLTPPPPPTPTSTPTPTPTPEPFKRVFVTSTRYNGHLKRAANELPGPSVDTGLDGGDKICRNRASAAGLTGTWTAWLSNSSSNAKDRITWDGEYRLVDGNTTVAINKTGLIDGTIDNAINKSESGASVSDYVWTGTTQFGNKEGSRCGDWESDGIGFDGLYGYALRANEAWSAIWNTNCTQGFSLYCFEQ